MRSYDEVEKRYQEMYDKYYQKMYEEYTSRQAINCSHNVKTHVKGVGRVGYCNHPKAVEKRGRHKVVCEGCKLAKDCIAFTCKNSDEAIDTEFQKIVDSPARCGDKFPKLAILIWMLHGGDKSWLRRLYDNSIKRIKSWCKR